METSRSPRMVLLLAYRLGLRLLPTHCCRRSRQDFTLPQLFACLVLREFFGLSYRRMEQLLRDSPQWLSDINLRLAPDHNTLWRALD
ncbi:MAG: transposase, partial [Tepidisphaeraceae bacterium]